MLRGLRHRVRRHLLRRGDTRNLCRFSCVLLALFRFGRRRNWRLRLASAPAPTTLLPLRRNTARRSPCRLCFTSRPANFHRTLILANLCGLPCLWIVRLQWRRLLRLILGPGGLSSSSSLHTLHHALVTHPQRIGQLHRIREVTCLDSELPSQRDCRHEIVWCAFCRRSPPGDTISSFSGAIKFCCTGAHSSVEAKWQ